MAADWATISSLATAGGTLVLAIATFASVRSANRAARAAERSLLAGLRPVLMSSRMDDPPQKVGFQDEKWFKVEGSAAVIDVSDEAIYLVMSLRNVGTGMAILHGWKLIADPRSVPEDGNHDPSDFRRLTRDIYVPAGDVGFWQGAYREAGTPEFDEARRIVTTVSPFAIEILYGDNEGGQRVISRFAVYRRENGQYFSATSRHWNLDRSDPR
ncbi:MAG TPA: hypothetical protein VKQ07_09530 [Jatrophihabitantaceae bacterium]|nr:hypothetical protein [Jatrophihabitantaceae bacterium]